MPTPKKLAKLSDLTPDRRNANRGTERGAAVLDASIEELGAGRSIVVDRDGRTIAGNKTLAAFKRAGRSKIRVVESDGDTLVVVQRTDLNLLRDARAKKLAIADNRAGEVGLDWDEAIIRELSADLDLSNLFDPKELAEIVARGQAAEMKGDPDDVPPAPRKPKTKLGDVYTLGEHRLMCSSATDYDDVTTLLAGEEPHIVFTDPPYGISVQMNNPGTTCSGTILGDKTTAVAVDAFNMATRYAVPQIWWGANHYAFDARLPNSSCWLAWNKQEANNHIDQADCEFAWTNIKGPARQFHHLWAGFRRDSEKGETRVRPTQKPVALLVEILDFFKAGRIVADFFGGSGSTLIACEATGRAARIMELDPIYCDVICARYETLTGKKATRVRA